MAHRLVLALITCSGFVISSHVCAQDDGDDEVSEIVVTADRVANLQPAGTYSSVVTMLRFDPLTEVQSRGLPEGQADITVRGGLFENIGFKTGAVTIMDPQTGHYVAELPIDPQFLTAPTVLFNSNIATVEYALRSITDGGSVSLGAGNDSLQYQALRFSKEITERTGLAASAARSEGDGTVPNGDHEFERYNVQLQNRSDDAQTDVILSYQDKFYGWPGAYTGFASLAETDRTKTTLLLANHRNESVDGFWEVGGFYRRLEDDYDFDRTTQESGAAGSFDHETRVYGLGFKGSKQGAKLDWQFAGQLASDELVFSTDLTEGDFDTRDYATLSVVPTLEIDVGGAKVFIVEFGATVDWTSEDGSAISPVAGLTWFETTAAGSDFVSLEYASTSQVPGYTVLGSRPEGLFGGNASLGREKSRQVTLSTGRDAGSWDSKATVFYREDKDLVDWTFAAGAPFARQANAVDIDVLGSFYALNFAKQRATLAAIFRFTDRLTLRVDNEYRKQQSNPLRASSDNAYLVSASLAWEPPAGRGFGIALTADNLTDDDYQQFPGTPAVGRQVSLSARYAW
jgi:hypothetical protein